MMEHVLPPSTPRSTIGRYSGLVESVFSIASFSCMYQYGRLSDSRGRKPVILCGLIGIAASLVMLGLSRSYWMVLLARTLSGCLCGNASVLRAALGEITTQDNESWIYPLWSIGWDLSILCGPLIGAALAQPAEQYPESWIAKVAFFKEFPFFLPCAVAAGFAGLAFVLMFFMFEETLPATVNHQEGLDVEQDETVQSETSPLLSPKPKQAPVEPVKATMSARQLVGIPAVRNVLVSNFLLCFIALSFDAVFVLFTYSPVPLNGLALSHTAMALCFSLRGVLSIFLSLFILPVAQRKLGTSSLYRAFAGTWIACFALPPVMNTLARRDTHGTKYRWISEDGKLLRMWWLMGPLMVLYTMGDLAFPLNMLALNVAAPDQSVLGAINGISSSVAALARAMGPVTIG
ncbi:hypothetical protein QFC22_004976 [Naganishia vaughanmartiniae]|uniref:Uncharacterized protein n=1 Tax=Naganishia vaughanmartiniae TaxID=1424756 RepID=A0ACC2WXE3_9TREE|nr:hypothetical protein QFC22_004976 [Naganishia vaughanmartiniae]